VNEDGARRSSEYLLIIPQKTAARVMPGEATTWLALMC
jgi:hypothetical protein